MSSIERRRNAVATTDPDDTVPQGSEPVTQTKGQRNDPIAGVLWVTLAMALFAGLAASSRLAMSYGYHPLQVAFLRFASALLTMSI